jgi:hypothetical protein
MTIILYLRHFSKKICGKLISRRSTWKKHADLIHCTFSFLLDPKKTSEVQFDKLWSVDCQLSTILLHLLPVLYHQIYIL